jgi:hypothetical protein
MVFDGYDDTGFKCRICEIIGLEMHGYVTWAKVETVIDYDAGWEWKHSCLRLYGVDRGVMTIPKHA